MQKPLDQGDLCHPHCHNQNAPSQFRPEPNKHYLVSRRHPFTVGQMLEDMGNTKIPQIAGNFLYYIQHNLEQKFVHPLMYQINVFS